MTDNRRELRQYFPWGTGNPTFYLTLLFLAAALATTVVALTENGAVAFLGGLAAWMSGGIVGLVFGIPRYAASSTERAEQIATKPQAVKYRGNTNLEQISDWLTKILVGVGLTQFRDIAAALHTASERLGEALTGTSSTTSTTIAVALGLATAIPGFVFFYLWSRVYLPRLLGEAEKADLDKAGKDH